MFAKFFRFIWELTRWILSGGKIRSQKEMSKIYKICKQCPHFVEKGGFVEGFDKCGICECNLHEMDTKLNKIAWTTTKCPDDPRRW